MSGEAHMRGSIAPLSGVVIKCAGISTTSGTDGTYELPGVPEGTQTITAQRFDCDDYAYSLEVTSNVRHYVFLTFNGVDLSGIVSNAVDGPISGARLSIHGLVSFTDVAGKYEFSAVPHGADTLTVSHPNYNMFQTTISMTGSVAQKNIVLTRDSTMQGVAFLAKHVDELSPGVAYFLPLDHMFLKGNGPDTAAPTFRSSRRNIYIDFNFPPLLSDQRVSIVDANLFMCSDGPYPSVGIQTFSVQSAWFELLTASNQPATGSLLFSGYVCDSTGVKFWQVLGTDGFNRMLTSYRTQGMINGVVIKSNSAASVGFYSTLAALALRPRYTMRVRY